VVTEKSYRYWLQPISTHSKANEGTFGEFDKMDVDHIATMLHLRELFDSNKTSRSKDGCVWRFSLARANEIKEDLLDENNWISSSKKNVSVKTRNGFAVNRQLVSGKHGK
jgi:hypothetical protein